MARYAGNIGFATDSEEVSPGVWRDKIVERKYYGNITRNVRKLQPSGNLNDNITIANDISIVADPFASDNFHAIRYAELLGTKWKVNNVEVQYPRLILSLEGVYNV